MLAEDQTQDQIKLGDVVAGIGERGFGVLLILFALPVALPIPLPGVSAVLGAPLVLVATQLLLGWPRPWLPKLVSQRSISRHDLARLVEHVSPWLRRIERFAKPRLIVLPMPVAERLVGLVCLALAIVIVLPIPLGNILPSIAVVLFGFGLLERDGVLLLLALSLSIASFVIVAGVVYALARVAWFVLLGAFNRPA